MKDVGRLVRVAAPSTTLRVVPLPRYAVEDPRVVATVIPGLSQATGQASCSSGTEISTTRMESGRPRRQ
jgi:hypothetical protein